MIKIMPRQKIDKMLYVCKLGDTLDSIARDFGTSPSNILASNPLFSSVYPGCVLLLQNICKKTVVVQPMETLSSIAARYNTTVQKIIELNDLKSEYVFVGMQLLIED